MAKSKGGNAIAISDDERWKCERDLEYLIEAEKIKNDSKRLAKAQALAKEKMMAAAQVASQVAPETK